jgi:Mrp family chromosome partitioning ATPase
VALPAAQDGAVTRTVTEPVRSDLTSPGVLSRVLAQTEISNLTLVRSRPDREDAVTWLGRRLKVEPGGEPGVVEVTLEGPAAGDLLTLLQRVATTYLATRQDAELQVQQHLAQLRDRRADAEARLNLTRALRTAGTEATGAAERAALVRTRQDLSERLARFREQLREIRQQQDGQTNPHHQTDRQPLETFARQLETRIGSLTRQIAAATHALAEDDRLSQEVRRHEGDLAALQEQLTKAQAQADALPALRVARAPECRRVLGSRSVLALTGLPLGALCLVGWAVGRREARPRHIRSREDLASGLGIPILATVPALPSAERQRLQGVKPPPEVTGPEFVAALEAVRAVLVRGAKPDACRVVAVTSAGTGEGKSTLARHLAVSLAQAGLKTLLVDADGRRASAHQAFEQSPAPGLAELLRGEAGPAEAVRPTTTAEFLWLLPAGHWDGFTGGAPPRSGPRAVLEPLREEFAFIVVDAPPVLAGDGTFPGGQAADVALLSVLRNVSRAPQVQAAWQRLRAGAVRLGGAVFQGEAP